jgi:DNA-binding CsgD family transcriptional regulator
MRQLAFSIIDEAGDIEQVVHELRDVLQQSGPVEHLVYHSSKIGLRPSVDPYIKLTYPSRWIKRYLVRGYIHVDPVIRAGFERRLPFDWTELTIETPEEQVFFLDAVQHGVGTVGLSIPVINRERHRGLFTVSGECDQQKWESWWRPKISTLVEIGNHLHRTAVGDVLAPQGPRMRPRSVEALGWMSQGKTMSETGIIMGISPNTVRAYLQHARFALGVSNTNQAVRVAVEQGLIASQR